MGERIVDLNKCKGITLITLVITIIILLILAGITISSLAGKKGLLEKTKNAKEQIVNSEIEENIILEDYEKVISENLKNKGSSDKLLAEMFSFSSESSDWNVKNVKEALDYLYNN